MNPRLFCAPHRLQRLSLVSLLVLCPALAARAATQEAGSAGADTQQALAERASGQPRAWDHETSDVPVDARIHFGALDNGLRFAWAHNPEPWNRVYVRLHVDVGSFAEQESERGMAHFLEHMAFNGSEHYAAGTLIEWFQEHGMSFGADTNAHTSFSETVYKLDLPNKDEATLHDGLQVLRDFAGGLTLAENEVQAEKGVIDGEERERDSAGFRVFQHLLERQYAGTRYPVRIPIGIKAARDAFTAKSVRAFYERWYRPENMTLVVVGDLGELDPEPMIAELFGSLEAPKTPVEPEPALGEASFEDLQFAIHDDELPGAQISIANLMPWVERPDTIAEHRAKLPRTLAQRMLGLRYREAVKKEGTSFLSADVDDAGGLHIFEGGDLTIRSSTEKWEAAMREAFLELRKALQFGFLESELDEVRADALRALDEAVAREPKADSRELVSELLDVTEKGGVATDAATRREILAQAIRDLTVEDCVEALRANWTGGKLSLTAVGALELEDAKAQLTSAFQAALQVELERPDEVETKAFAYGSDAKSAGEISERRLVEDLDFTQVVFANGVRLNVKVTDFKKKQILLRVCAGSGALGLADDQLVTAELFGPLYVGGGLAEHDADELRRLTAGRQARVSLSVEEDHFELNAATTAEDLLLQFEMACAYLQEPGYRPDALNAIRPQLPLMFEQYRHSPTGPLRLEFLPAVLAGDQRARVLDLSATPTLAQMEAIDMKSVRAASAKLVDRSPLEITVVGDTDVEAVIALAARTFGQLPERQATPEPEEMQGAAHVASGVHMEREIETANPKATLIMLFPTEDGFDDARRRNIFFLGRIVDDRLRLEVRERLGAAYSPSAGAQASRIFSGLGAIMIQAAGDPAKKDELLQACRDVARDLAEKGITQEEVERISEPILNMLRDAQRQNGYWIDGLSRAQFDPHTLEGVRTLISSYRDLDAKVLSELAARYMPPDKASSLIVLPKPVQKSTEAPAEDH